MANYNEELFECIENEIRNAWGSLSINQIRPSSNNKKLSISIIHDNPPESYVEYTKITPKDDKIALEMTHDKTIGFVPESAKDELIEKIEDEIPDICSWIDLDFIDGEWIANAYCESEKELGKVDDPQKMCQIIAESDNFSNEMNKLSRKIERKGTSKLFDLQKDLDRKFGH